MCATAPVIMCVCTWVRVRYVRKFDQYLQKKLTKIMKIFFLAICEKKFAEMEKPGLSLPSQGNGALH